MLIGIDRPAAQATAPVEQLTGDRPLASFDTVTFDRDTHRAAGGGGTLTRSRARTARRRTTRRTVTMTAAGLAIGFLTGFLGIGGGCVIVPVLVQLLRLPMPVAVGTSLLVIAVNAMVALAARAGTGSFAWDVIVPFTAAAVAGSVAGEKVAERLSATRLTVGFAVLLVAVAVYVGSSALLSLT